MELRLAKLITAVEKISDIHNLDFSNPVLYNMNHPEFNPDNPSVATGLVAKSFRFAVSVDEPVHVGMPINGLWAVMNPNNMYYRTVLKLKSGDSPQDSDVEGAIIDGGFESTWIRIGRYDQMFDEAQYVGTGPRGEKGETGDRGIVHRLSWDATRLYAPAEGVIFEGGFYVARLPNKDTAPESNPDSWYKLADAGDAPEVDYDYLLQEIRERLGWQLPS